MKTRYWIIVLVIAVIVVIGIIFFACDSFPHPFSSWGKHRAANQVNQYEVFRDLLAIFLTLVGLGGFAVYKLISKNVETMVKKKIEEGVNYAMAGCFLQLGYDCWEAYEVRDESQQYKENQLERAITLSTIALKKAEGLNIKQKEFKRITCEIKNGLAYHLTVRGRIKEGQDAISLAKYAYDEVQDFDFERTCNWKETYAFALIKMGTLGQRREGKKILGELQGHVYLPKPLRDSIKRKYTERLALKAEWKKIRKD